MVESSAPSRTVVSSRLPIPADPLLARDHLVARLRQLPAAGVALVVSPVGFGATSLLAMAAREHAGPLIWLTARGAVGDGATEFWRRLAAELQDAGAPFASAPSATPPSPQPQVLELAGAAPMGEPDVLLVLDDVPRDDTLDGRLQRLLDELPAAVRVWVSTRTEPRWDTAGWVASGRLLVLDRPALTLSSEESDEFVRALAPALAPDRRSALVDAAGGRIGALRAGLSAASAEPGIDPAAWLLGPGLDLLFRRAIADLDPADRDLLVTCSVLDRISADACRALTGRADGAERLGALAEHLLVLREHSAGRTVYKVDPLLREYLRRLLAERGRGAARDAHRAAGLWLAEQGDAEAAITHLLDCGEVSRARDVLASHVRHLLDHGQFDRVRLWYRQAPELAVPDQHLHLLGAAWSELLSGDIAAARPHLVELEGAADAGMRTPASGGAEAEAGAAEWLAAEALYLRAYLESWEGHTGRALEHVRRYRALIGEEWSRTAHQAAVFLEVRLQLWHDDEQAARALMLAVSSRPGTLQFFRGVALPSLEALLAERDGRAHRAAFLAASALHAVESSGRIGAADDLDALLARALAEVDLGQPARAVADIARLEQVAVRIQDVPYQVLAASARARVAAVSGSWADAEESFDQARRVLAEHGAAPPLARLLEVARTEAAFLCGERAAARRALAQLPPGRSRDRLAIRVLSMGGGLKEADVVRQIQRARPQAPGVAVDARMLMAALTAQSRPAEAEMHLRQAASIAHEIGYLTALRGRSEEVLLLADRLAPRDRAVAALTGQALQPLSAQPRATVPLSRGELALLDHLATTRGNRELATELGISANTLKTRLRRLYRKLGVHDREGALRATAPRS